MISPKRHQQGAFAVSLGAQPPGPAFARRPTAGKEPMETEKHSPKTLQECEDKVRQLEEENQHLREASDTFGQLAERLNVTLRNERRAGNDRRHRPRPDGERRQSRESTLKLAPHTSDDEE